MTGRVSAIATSVHTFNRCKDNYRPFTDHLDFVNDLLDFIRLLRRWWTGSGISTECETEILTKLDVTSSNILFQAE
jgi:hypothetical protein